MALLQAALENDIVAVKDALAAGEPMRGAALVRSVSRNNIEIVKVLLAAGADPNSTFLGSALSQTTNKKIVRLLLDAGARVNAAELKTNDLDILELLLPSASQSALAEAFIRSAEVGNLSKCKLLLRHGMDVSTFPLSEVCINLGIVKMFVSAGANVAANNNAALLRACGAHAYPVVRYLCVHGAPASLALERLGSSVPYDLRIYLFLSIQPQDAHLLTPAHLHVWLKMRSRLRLRLRRFWYDRCVPKLWAPPAGTLAAQPTEHDLKVYLATAGRLWARQYWKEDVHMFFPVLGAQLGVCPF